MSRSFYLIAGLGQTGLSVARYLHRRRCAFIAFDTRAKAPNLDSFQQAFPDVPLYVESLPDEVLAKVTDVIASPGLPLNLPLLEKAKASGISIYGDIECLAREIHAPVVAITGTNGKSTVTALVGEMAKTAGLQVAVAGNIGTPVLDLLDTPKDYDLWVLELSSFQLDLTSSLAPKAATVLNISPDHLDRHQTLEAYVSAKQRIYQKAQLAIFNREEAVTKPQKDMPCVSFGPEAPILQTDWGVIEKLGRFYLAKGQECLLSVDALKIKGVHNWLNALAACALAEAAGIALPFVLQVLQSFPGLAHRCQWVQTLDEVTWINDSKGTNIGATISAIKGIGPTIAGQIVLIAGGQGKGADFRELAPAVSEYVRTVIVIGEDANKIEQALSDVVPVIQAHSLEEAVVLAKNKAIPQDVVLLSPACASLDMFRDFNHRGECFTSLVKDL